MKRQTFALLVGFSTVLVAADQLKVGEGNEVALKTGQSSPLVQMAMGEILKNVDRIKDQSLREATLDALRNPASCVAHRVRVTAEVKGQIERKLKEEGLLNEYIGADAGIFPPLKDDGTACPQMPLPMTSTPGSSFGGHHSYPGGLAVHEAFNLQSSLNYAKLYRGIYGRAALIDDDVLIGAPAWHDWAKSMVFQWNADGSEFAEFNFGGTGINDNYGMPGDSRTGAHHILGLAETMARGLSALLVVTQASAHAAPSLGNEYKVVNWLRAAALIARIDPVAKGYLAIDASGHLRLPPLKHLGDGIDLNKNGQANLLLEYQIHSLSDGDFVESLPAASAADLLLKTVAKQFGYDPAATAAYNNRFRNVVLAFVGPERLSIVYGNYGLGAVIREIRRLKQRNLI